MRTESRTKNSIRNSIVALLFYFVNLILQFFSRKVFFEYLGDEVLGLTTTATNLLQFMNLAELGIGTAVAYTLYKPLADRDKNSICEIVSLQGWLYRKIAYFVIIGSIILMCFFPLIFKKISLPTWYPYATYIVLTTSALLSYFFNYKQVLLSADQQEYKIQYSYKAVMTLKISAQILCIYYLENGYVWWLILEVIFAILASYALTRTIRKAYPFVITDLSKGKLLSKKYSDFSKKIKQLFFHKIGTFALTQTSPLIIYAYISLAAVAIYGNYALIVSGCTSLMIALFNGMSASVGNLVAQGDKSRIMNVFYEFFSVRFVIVSTVSYGVYFLTPSIINIWVGSSYILSNATLLIMVIQMFITLMKSTIESFSNAYGLYSDIWAPITEALLNISLSIILGAHWGLNGILTGVLISQILIIFLWKPIFLFYNGFKCSMVKYWRNYSIHFIILLISLTITRIFYNQCKIDIHNYVKELLFTIIFLIILVTCVYIASTGMRQFFKRIIKLI